MTKVSIIIINYNDKLRVGRAISSALNQTHSNCEVIVVDDGSDKETREIYKKYDVKLIQLERTDKSARTPSGARNAGFKHATGEYVYFLDSDNYIANNFVEEMLKPMKDVTFCNWEIVGLNPYKVEIEKTWDLNNSVLQNYLQFTHLDHQCILAKKSLLEKLNDNGLPYDTRFPRSQDCDLLVGLMLQTKEWELVPKNLFTFETHEKDQMKQYASIHGKVLWTLKRGINIHWLAGIVAKDPMLMLSFYKALNDFMTAPEWAEDFKKSEFALYYKQFCDILKGERIEK